jgi:hypothetical protein
MQHYSAKGSSPDWHHLRLLVVASFINIIASFISVHNLENLAAERASERVDDFSTSCLPNINKACCQQPKRNCFR